MKKSELLPVLIISLCFLAGCAGGSNGPVTYTVGGMVAGLTGSGLVLQDNAGNNLAVSAAGPFTFTAALAAGSTYSVSVFSQPVNPVQTCAVTSGSGSLSSGNVTSVLVTCAVKTTYTVGGTVINLAGAGGGLHLQDNGGDTLSVNANGSFTFPTALAIGSVYNVTVFQQPSAPAQTCEVTHGSGTSSADLTSVAVDCGHNEWTWVGGPNLAYNTGTYGTLGTPASGNIPGTRYGGSTWTDSSGNFWLFGGYGYGAACCLGELNDLWKYGAGEWTWMSGSNVINQKGTYGIQGTANPGNNPGAREGSVSWTDAAGNFWLFGGYGRDSSAGTSGQLNDLWKYSAGKWTWMSGSNVIGLMGTGIYGNRGTPAPGNVPGTRQYGVGWTDAAGNLWLFGGFGFDSVGTLGYLNDLWKYSAGEWTWMSGSNLANQNGTYGAQGMPAPESIPGGRYHAVTWTDETGNFWLFGGVGADSVGTSAEFLNDLWKYNAGQWTWMSGSNLANMSGTYGTQGTPASGNAPGARGHAKAWTDASGNLWLFSGFSALGLFNDSWEYSSGQWTWIGGSNIPNDAGTYGTQGTPAPSNIPGARGDSAIWKDAEGIAWLFGGFGIDSQGGGGNLNDLWKYDP